MQHFYFHLRTFKYIGCSTFLLWCRIYEFIWYWSLGIMYILYGSEYVAVTRLCAYCPFTIYSSSTSSSSSQDWLFSFLKVNIKSGTRVKVWSWFVFFSWGHIFIYPTLMTQKNLTKKRMHFKIFLRRKNMLLESWSVFWEIRIFFFSWIALNIIYILLSLPTKYSVYWEKYLQFRKIINI